MSYLYRATVALGTEPVEKQLCLAESKSGRICGCFRFAVVLISVRNGSAPMTAAHSGLSTLIATFRSCLRSSARQTVAMPLSPILGLVSHIHNRDHAYPQR